jgi:hypothetical protein
MGKTPLEIDGDIARNQHINHKMTIILPTQKSLVIFSILIKN